MVNEPHAGSSGYRQKFGKIGYEYAKDIRLRSPSVDARVDRNGGTEQNTSSEVRDPGETRKRHLRPRCSRQAGKERLQSVSHRAVQAGRQSTAGLQAASQEGGGQENLL